MVSGLFPKLQSFHIFRIPDGRGSRFFLEDKKRINDLIEYLDAYENEISSSGMSIGMTLVNGRVLESKQELKEIQEQLVKAAYTGGFAAI